MGGQAAVTGHVEIGDHVIVGGRGGISKNVPPNEVMWGSPVSTTMRQAKEEIASVRRLPKLVERVKRLEHLVNSAPKQSSGNQTLEAEAAPR